MRLRTDLAIGYIPHNDTIDNTESYEPLEDQIGEIFFLVTSGYREATK